MIQKMIVILVLMSNSVAWAHDLTCAIHDLATGHELASVSTSSEFKQTEAFKVEYPYMDLQGAIVLEPRSEGHHITLVLSQPGSGEYATATDVVAFDQLLTGYHEFKPIFIEAHPSGDTIALKCSLLVGAN